MSTHSTFPTLVSGALVGLMLLAAPAMASAASSDSAIEGNIKSRIVSNRAMDLTDIGVFSDNGQVRLYGTVDSADQVGLAESYATSVDGVRGVQNDLSVRQSMVK